MEMLLFIFAGASVLCLLMWQRADGQAAKVPGLQREVDRLKLGLTTLISDEAKTRNEIAAKAAIETAQLRAELDTSRIECADLKRQISNAYVGSVAIPTHPESAPVPPLPIATPPETFHKERALSAAREGRLARSQLLRILDNAHRMDITNAERAEFEAALKVKRPDSYDPALVASALVVVSTSGWGNEPEVTTPGVIQPQMNL